MSWPPDLLARSSIVPGARILHRNGPRALHRRVDEDRIAGIRCCVYWECDGTSLRDARQLNTTLCFTQPGLHNESIPEGRRSSGSHEPEWWKSPVVREGTGPFLPERDAGAFEACSENIRHVGTAIGTRE
jgi:hypothetical protein